MPIIAVEKYVRIDTGEGKCRGEGETEAVKLILRLLS